MAGNCSCSSTSSSTWGFFSPHLFSHSSSSAKSILFQPNHKSRRFSRLLVSSSDSSRPPLPPPPKGEPDESDPVKRAFAKSEAYRKSKAAAASRQSSVVNRVGINTGGSADDAVASEVLDPVRIAMDKAKEYKKNKESAGAGRAGTGSSTGSASSDLSQEESIGSNQAKRIFAKSVKYRDTKVESATNNVDNDGGSGEDAAVLEAPDPIRIAMEKAREYKKNKGLRLTRGAESRGTGPQKMTTSNASDSKDVLINDKLSKREKPTISSIDFIGLNFSDKKNDRRLPAGLSRIVEPLPEGDLPEVEIIVGDASKLEDKSSTKTVSDEYDDGSSLYKPKVSTWGVFPRPDNISKAYGGGRIIRPGEELETAEVKAAKDARIRESIASYKSRLGLNIDAKIKIKCQKALREGDHLMELGKLQDALPYYEEVMSSVVFQNELHGLAALQWSICQDSLRRTDIARDMYEKLKSHPNVQVSKKARQFMFGFQAMEMLKVTASSFPRTTGYENYFDAFLEEKANYTQEEDGQKEDSLKQESILSTELATKIRIVNHSTDKLNREIMYNEIDNSKRYNSLL